MKKDNAVFNMVIEDEMPFRLDHFNPIQSISIRVFNNKIQPLILVQRMHAFFIFFNFKILLSLHSHCATILTGYYIFFLPIPVANVWFVKRKILDEFTAISSQTEYITRMRADGLWFKIISIGMQDLWLVPLN